MKLLIDVDEELYKAYKDRPPMLGDEGMDMIAQAIANGTPYEEKPFEINVFLENADESTLFDIKKELAQILTDRAEREAYAEARREAMKLDDNEDTLKWKGTH